MLISLKISDFVLIDKAELRTDPRLTVITGETGSGKSVILSALNLLLGDRAGDDYIRRGTTEARLEAMFNIENAPGARRILDEMGLEDMDEVLIRRKLIAGSKSRCYINNMPATVGQLRELGETLINIHGQNEHQSLVSAQSQLAIIDAFGSLSPELEKYSSAFAQYSKALEKLETLKNKSRDTEERCDFLSFQIEEIENANLGSEEDEEEIENEKTKLENLSSIQESVNTLLSLSQSDEGGIEGLLARMRSEMDELSEIDSFFSDQLETADSAITVIRDVISDIENYADSLVFDEDRYQQLDQHCQTLRKLRKKHGSSIEEIKAKLDEYKEELDSIINSDAAISKAKQEADALKKELAAMIQAIYKKRKTTAVALAAQIQTQLRELNIPHAIFEIAVLAASAPEQSPGSAQFNISLNKGQPPKPLSKIASGGEMSRVMLAIKNVVASHDEVPTLIFDEIDANIGGEAASAVGRKLRKISQQKQVLCITHLPHIARLGDTHLCVSKHSPDKNKTMTRVDALDREQRERELARMLSGDSVSDLTLEHARELLNQE